MAIVLNVNGTVGEISKELKDALHYMAGQEPASGYARALDSAVKEVKVNEKWRRDYMTLALKLQEREEVARLEGKISSLRELRGQLSDQALAKAFHINKEMLELILQIIDNSPDKSDWDIASEIINEY